MGLFDFIRRKAVPPPPAVSKRAQANIRATRSYESALTDRLTASFNAAATWANDEIRSALETTRNRARELANNNEYAKKYLQLVVANVVGPAGFSLQAQASEAGAPDRLARQLIEDAFSAWSARGTCDLSGRLSFCDIQRLVVETWARDGEALLIQHTGKAAGNDYGYALQLLETDRLPVYYSRELNAGHITMGVEVDDYGRAVAYWLNLERERAGMASASQAKLTRVPAEQVIHLYKPGRPEQLRGMPQMHAVMRGLKMLDAYEEAAIVAANVGAAKMGFFTMPAAELDSDGRPIGTDMDDAGEFVTDASAGEFQLLPQGAQFQEWSPEYPHQAYPAFIKARLRSVASGLGVTYHGLANDLEGVNFSSIRSGTLEERDAWMVLQRWFIDAFLRPVYGAWLKAALTAGAITYPQGAALPASKLTKFAAHTWLGRRWGWVDPLKDIEAARLAIKSGISSPQMIAAQAGVDVEDVVQAIADFEQLVADSAIKTVSYSETAATPAPADASAAARSADILRLHMSRAIAETGTT